MYSTWLGLTSDHSIQIIFKATTHEAHDVIRLSRLISISELKTHSAWNTYVHEQRPKSKISYLFWKPFMTLVYLLSTPCIGFRSKAELFVDVTFLGCVEAAISLFVKTATDAGTGSIWAKNSSEQSRLRPFSSNRRARTANRNRQSASRRPSTKCSHAEQLSRCLHVPCMHAPFLVVFLTKSLMTESGISLLHRKTNVEVILFHHGFTLPIFYKMLT